VGRCRASAGEGRSILEKPKKKTGLWGAPLGRGREGTAGTQKPLEKKETRVKEEGHQTATRVHGDGMPQGVTGNEGVAEKVDWTTTT